MFMGPKGPEEQQESKTKWCYSSGCVRQMREQVGPRMMLKMKITRRKKEVKRERRKGERKGQRKEGWKEGIRKERQKGRRKTELYTNVSLMKRKRTRHWNAKAKS